MPNGVDDAIVAADDQGTIIPYSALFTFNQFKSDQNVTVLGDGSTLVNVYYLRNYFELHFVTTAANRLKTYPTHTHSDSCYEFCCGVEEHTHTSDCLICKKTEHVHTDACCGKTAHTHTESCVSGTIRLLNGSGTAQTCTVETAVSNPTGATQQPNGGPMWRTGTGNSNYVFYVYVTKAQATAKYPAGYHKISQNNPTMRGVFSVTSTYANYKFDIPTYSCGKTEHVHSDLCCSTPAHTHTLACYSCGKNAHTHVDSCKRLICQATDKPTTVNVSSTYPGNGQCYTVYMIRAKYGAVISDVWPMEDLICTKLGIMRDLLFWRKVIGVRANQSDYPTKRMRLDIDLVGYDNNGVGVLFADLSSSTYTINLNYYFTELVYNGTPIANIDPKFYGSANRKIYNNKVYYDWADPLFTTTNDQSLPTDSTGKNGFDANAIEGMINGSAPNQQSGQIVIDDDKKVTNQSLFYDREQFSVTIKNCNDYIYNAGVPVNTNFRSCGLQNVQYGLPYSYLTFNYNGTTLPLSELDARYLPYPSNLEKGAYVFEGWYTTSDCLPGTEFDPSNGFITDDLLLYAHWIPTTHDVWVFFDNSDLTKDPENPKLITSENCEKAEDLNGREIVFDGTYPIVVSHGEDLSTKLPIVAQRTDDMQQYLAGWFYVDPETGLETAYYPTIPVTYDMCIYAKWESNKVVQYTINYILDATEEDIENGYVDGEPVAKTLTGSTLAGRSLTFLAKGEIEWYDKFHNEWLFPNVASHVMYMSSEESDNVFTFEYRMVSSNIDYKIVYVDAETGEVITSENRTLYIAQATHKSSILNIPAKIFDAAGTYAKYYYYLPDAYEKQLQLTYTGVPEVDLANNTLYFYYSDPYKEDPEHPTPPSPKMAPYQVNFEYEVDGNYEMFSSYDYSIEANATIAEADLASYLESGKKTGYGQSPSAVYVKTYEYNSTTGVYDEISETYTTDKLKDLKIPEQGALIVFRYDLLEYDYTVNYVREDDHDYVVATKTTGKAKYGETLVVTAKSVPGYSMPVPPTQSEIVYADTEFTFYYTSGQVTINYQRIGVDLENFTRMLVPPSDLVGYTSGILTYSMQLVDIATGKVVDEDDKAPYNSAEATEGYEFAGWYTAAVGEDGKDDIYVLTLVTKNAEFYPQPTVVGEGGKEFYGDITYYALFLPKTIDMTIVRENAKEKETFIYHIVSKKIYEEADPVDIYVSIRGNDSVTVKGLPFGEYDIIEESDWSWRYEIEKYENATLTGAENVFTFDGDRTDKKWFSDEAKVNNDYTGLEAETSEGGN